MMTSKNFAILDMENDSEELNDELKFQDYGQMPTQSYRPMGAVGGNPSTYEQTLHFDKFPDTPDEDGFDGSEKPTDLDIIASALKPGPSFWTFPFYQQFFDVESKQVGERIMWSMLPKPGINYLQSKIRPNPDLYGPFWICLTLVFTTAITGNLANYLQAPLDNHYIWKYNFHKVTFAATAIFSYAWLVPVMIWVVLAWRGNKASVSLLELVCLYGYSLAIFVPVSILWVLPQPWFQWCLAIVAPVLSGTVLVRTIWPALSTTTKQLAVVMAIVILVIHLTLALGFMLYFFHPPDHSMTHMVDVAESNSSLLPNSLLDLEQEKKKTAAQPPAANMLKNSMGNGKGKEKREGMSTEKEIEEMQTINQDTVKQEDTPMRLKESIKEEQTEENTQMNLQQPVDEMNLQQPLPVNAISAQEDR